jgi:CubicO group peptidase (beta-lactamase class C family)
VVLVGQRGKIVYRAAFGSLALTPGIKPMQPDAIFDLASLTKVIATTTAVMQLVEARRIKLDQPIARYWPAFGRDGKAGITVRQLLTHTSGLRPDLDLTHAWFGLDAALDRVVAERPLNPAGSRFLYSDINFIVLGELVRRVSGEPLETYARRHIFRPLHMTDTGFRPPQAERDRIVPTDREEGTIRWGEVQDPTAYRMGGVAGHAGLFSTADDLAKFAKMLLGESPPGGVRILRADTIAAMTRGEMLPGAVVRGLGWDIASPYAAGMDVAFGPHTFGHTGYTGTSVWIDPVRQSFLILLTSRLHPDGRGDVRRLRALVAQAVAVATQPVGVTSVSITQRATGAVQPNQLLVRGRAGSQVAR